MQSNRGDHVRKAGSAQNRTTWLRHRTNRLLLLCCALTLASAEVARANSGAFAPPPAEEAPTRPSPAPRPTAGNTLPAVFDRTRLVSVTMRNSQRYLGYVAGSDEVVIELRLQSGGVIEIARSQIWAVDEVAADVAAALPRLRDPNRTRYLYGPSALTLRQGEAYFSQKQIIFSALAYGVTDNLTLLVGAVLPGWLVGPNGFNLILGGKFGHKVADKLHVAVGAETIVLPQLRRGRGMTGLGFVFANGSVGDSEAHMTVSVGYPFELAGHADSPVGPLIVTVNGNVRLSDGFALLTENWLVTTAHGGFEVIDSLALRVINPHSAWDFGFIGLPSSGDLVPWIDYTYNF